MHLIVAYTNGNENGFDAEEATFSPSGDVVIRLADGSFRKLYDEEWESVEVLP